MDPVPQIIPVETYVNARKRQTDCRREEMPWDQRVDPKREQFF